MRISSKKCVRTQIPPFILLIAALLFSLGVNSQNITKAEYFFNSDPGFGLGTDIPVSASPNITNLQFSIGLTTLQYGFHTLYVRAKDQNGLWSLSKTSTFYKLLVNTASLPDITKAEYFMDTDPGFGLGTNVPVTPSPNITSLPFTIDLGNVSSGFHMLFVRVKDGNGRWSFSQVKSFYNLIMNTVTLQNITKVEYFIDIDPGFGLGNNIPVTPSTNISNLQFSIDLGAVPTGFHMLYVRARDGNGVWSTTQIKSLYKVPVYLPVIPQVSKVEYFIDTDPGFGMGNNIPVTPSTNINNLQYTIDLTPVSIGFHILYVRAKDGNGKWSTSQVKSFYKTEVSTALVNVTKVEYFFDTDPGRGMATNIPVTPSTNLNNLSLIIDASQLPIGQHSVWVRAMDGSGKWSHVSGGIFIQANLPVGITIAADHNGVCAGTPVIFTATPVNGGANPTYQWKINGVNSGTNSPVFSYAPVNSDIVTCVLTSSLANVTGNPATSNALTLIVNPTVPVSLSIAASLNPVCPGTPVTLTATPVNEGSNPIYHWTVNGISAGTNNPVYNYLPAMGDVITCSLTSNEACAVGNPAASNQIVISVSGLNPTITGSPTACAGNSSVSYSTETGMSGYSWNVSAGGQIISGIGTNTINVLWSTAGAKTVSVIYSNGTCFPLNPGLLNVTVTSVPGNAGNISGPAGICTGTEGISYSVSPIPGATSYQWSLPFGATFISGEGTNTIVLNFSYTTFTSGILVVRGANLCGTGAQSPELTISARPLLTGQKSLLNITVSSDQHFCESAQGITTAGTGSMFLVQNLGEATLIASQNIRLLPGTTANYGGKLHAFITTECAACGMLKVTDEDSNLMIGSHSNTDMVDQPTGTSFVVYPNPTSGTFKLLLKDKIINDLVFIEIYNNQGRKLLTESYPYETEHPFSISNLPAGIYFLRIVSGETVNTIKVIRR